MPWSNSPGDRRRSAQTYGSAWRKARDAAMRRAHGRCELRLDGCIGAASEVDHIVGVADGGGHDQSNLRPVCGPCHAKRTAQQGGGFRSGRRTDPPAQPRTQW